MKATHMLTVLGFCSSWLAHVVIFRLFTFGAGRRACPGEVLAKNRLFLIITSLFQAFRFLPTQGEMAPNHDPRTFKLSLALQIKEYEVVAQPRKLGQY